MDLKFCNLCYNLMDFCLENSSEDVFEPVYVCCQCSNKEKIELEKITIKLKKKTNVKESKNTNEYFQLDPTLPYIKNKNINCVNNECVSNKTKQKEIKYIKYDDENFKYMYLCCICGQKWTNESE